MNRTNSAHLLTKEQTVERMRAAGVDYSVSTLRVWRTTWPDGQRKGPMPLIIGPRKLRYRPSDVDDFVKATIEAAERMAGADSEG